MSTPKGIRGVAAHDAPRRRRPGMPLIASVALALLLIHLFTRLSLPAAGFEFRARARLDWPPQTRVIIPPVGEIRAPTHSGLISFDITLWSVDMDTVRSLLLGVSEPANGALARGAPPRPEELVTTMSAAVRDAAQWLLLRAAGLGLLGGLIGIIWIGGIRSFRPVRRWIGAAALGVGLSLALLLPAYGTYNTDAFTRAEYQGIIETAPWMLEAVRDSLGHIDLLGRRLRTIAANLYTLFEQLDELGNLGLPPADLIVLHVSDIHNNPAAFDFIESIARRFAVDFIIDTGDLTDWATPLEADLIERVGRLGLPYIVIPGNHESPLVVERLRATRHVRVLQDELISMMGLRIYGFADPSSRVPSPRALSPREALKEARRIEEAVAALNEPVDLIALHNHRAAAALPDGLAQAIVFGHNHQASIDLTGSTVRINAGTTGAAGIRGLQGGEPVPYSLAIMYFARTGPDRTPISPPEGQLDEGPPGGGGTPGELGDVNGDPPLGLESPTDGAPDGDGPEDAASRDLDEPRGAPGGPAGVWESSEVNGTGDAIEGAEPGDDTEDTPFRDTFTLAVIDTIKVFTLPARGLTLERFALEGWTQDRIE